MSFRDGLVVVFSFLVGLFGVRLLVGCGGEPFTIVDGAVDAAVDGSELRDVAVDVSWADVVRDVDAGDVDASADASEPPDVCTPLAWPIAPPAACAYAFGTLDGSGRVWELEPCSTPPDECAPGAYPVAPTVACEDCREHYNCACFARHDGGGVCVDSDAGPYFLGCQ